MAKQYCTNPSCPKNDIYLSLLEVDDSLNPVTDPLSFTIRIDLDTGEEINPSKRHETVSLLVEEFLNELTEEMKEDFLSVIHSTKNEEKRLAEYRLNR